MYRWGSVGLLPDWFLDLKLGDWPLHILVARSGKIELMDEVMAVYRMHSAGMWTSGQAIDQKYAMMRMLKALDHHLNSQYTKAIRRAFAVKYFDMAIIERLEPDGHSEISGCIASQRPTVTGRQVACFDVTPRLWCSWHQTCQKM